MPQVVIKFQIIPDYTLSNMPKTEKFIGKNANIERIATRIENYLTENKFEVAFSRDVSGESHTYLIQARKSGLIRTVSGSRRSTDITISGQPNNFEIKVGTGEWGKNLVTSAPLFVIPLVGIATTVTKLYTAKKFEDNLWSFVKDQVKYLENTHTKDQTNLKEYPCEYVEGYSEWKSPIRDCKLFLEYNSGNSCIILKTSIEQGLKIPATKIESAKIIMKRSKENTDDRMIQITFRDDHDKKRSPIFNFDDDIIRGVLAGIDELVSETKLQQMTLAIKH